MLFVRVHRARSDGALLFGKGPVIHRPAGVGAFQFVVLSTLRAAQLIRGCTPRVDGIHKKTVIAQLEVSEGKVTQDLTQPRPTDPIA